jgi:hypothetical protein
MFCLCCIKDSDSRNLVIENREFIFYLDEVKDYNREDDIFRIKIKDRDCRYILAYLVYYKDDNKAKFVFKELDFVLQRIFNFAYLDFYIKFYEKDFDSKHAAL